MVVSAVCFIVMTVIGLDIRNDPYDHLLKCVTSLLVFSHVVRDGETARDNTNNTPHRDQTRVKRGVPHAYHRSQAERRETPHTDGGTRRVARIESNLTYCEESDAPNERTSCVVLRLLLGVVILMPSGTRSPPSRSSRSRSPR